MKEVFCIIFFCFYLSISSAFETKIIHNIQDEIITNIDIKNEFKYLLALNNKLKELDKDKILNIANESIIKEKIKKIEISKYFKEIKLNEEYSDILLKNMYLRLGIESLNQFKLYLKDYDLDVEDVEKKITIDALWNELIIEKYANRISINKEKIKQEITKNKNLQSKEYHLFEIIFDVKNKNEIEEKYNEINKSINEIGFKNSASIYSFSQSAKIGGDIGWVNENSLNNKIKDNIINLRIGEISKPIILSSGILVLKINDIKNYEINYENELKKAINYERNRQLNQYSKIYFNKIKKNLEFNE